MSFLTQAWDAIFGNPADEANKYISKIGDTAKNYYTPWTTAGKAAMGQMTPVFNQMTANPSDYMAQIMSGYQQSPQFQNALQQALRAAQGSAAAGGMTGSSQDQLNEANIADYMSQNDMQNYLNNVLGIQKTGLAGETGLANTGYNATQELANSLMNMYGTQGTEAYNAAQNRFAGLGDLGRFLTSPTKSGTSNVIGDMSNWMFS